MVERRNDHGIERADSRNNGNVSFRRECFGQTMIQCDGSLRPDLAQIETKKTRRSPAMVRSSPADARLEEITLTFCGCQESEVS